MIEVLGFIISLISLFFTVLIWVIGLRISTEQKVEHNKQMRKEFLKIEKDIQSGNIEKYALQIRNSRMWENPCNLYFNKFSFHRGRTVQKAYIEKVDAMGVWVILLTNNGMVELQNHKFFLASYIPYEWVQALDDEDERISDFIDNETQKIIYVKAPYFKFPYKFQNILSISEAVREGIPSGKKTADRKDIMTLDCIETVKIDFSSLNDSDWKKIKKQERINRKFFSFDVRKHRIND
ncbi:hypothetical protein ABLU29_13145 [Lactococcus lactis]|uniref:hypothetical protein n=1 Tax=Lactococcus lactis TaxID=1358 RepID=UPI003878234A